jgi:hypothetical protein
MSKTPLILTFPIVHTLIPSQKKKKNIVGKKSNILTTFWRELSFFQSIINVL